MRKKKSARAVIFVLLALASLSAWAVNSPWVAILAGILLILELQRNFRVRKVIYE